jgi:hypothetical protein
VLAEDQVVGPFDCPNRRHRLHPGWTLSYGQHKGRRTPTHGYGATCEAAMQAFARTWRRE